MVHAFYPSIPEAEAGGFSVSLRPTWYTDRVPGQLELLYRTVRQRNGALVVNWVQWHSL